VGFFLFRYLVDKGDKKNKDVDKEGVTRGIIRSLNFSTDKTKAALPADGFPTYSVLPGNTRL
jgi:hypothetical protein